MPQASCSACPTAGSWCPTPRRARTRSCSSSGGQWRKTPGAAGRPRMLPLGACMNTQPLHPWSWSPSWPHAWLLVPPTVASGVRLGRGVVVNHVRLHIVCMHGVLRSRIKGVATASLLLRHHCCMALLLGPNKPLLSCAVPTPAHPPPLPGTRRGMRAGARCRSSWWVRWGGVQRGTVQTGLPCLRGVRHIIKRVHARCTPGHVAGGSGAWCRHPLRCRAVQPRGVA